MHTEARFCDGKLKLDSRMLRDGARGECRREASETCCGQREGGDCCWVDPRRSLGGRGGCRWSSLEGGGYDWSG